MSLILIITPSRKREIPTSNIVLLVWASWASKMRYMQLRIPYASEEAVEFADRSMELISYYAIEAS